MKILLTIVIIVFPLMHVRSKFRKSLDEKLGSAVHVDKKSFDDSWKEEV